MSAAFISRVPGPSSIDDALTRLALIDAHLFDVYLTAGEPWCGSGLFRASSLPAVLLVSSTRRGPTSCGMLSKYPPNDDQIGFVEMRLVTAFPLTATPGGGCMSVTAETVGANGQPWRQSLFGVEREYRVSIGTPSSTSVMACRHRYRPRRLSQ